MPSITAVLTAYRRPHLVARQVEAIRSQSVRIEAIWAWANEPDERMRSELDRAALDRVVTSSQNAYVHARFALAMLARTEFVAVFDDDTIPGDGWLENCVETFGRSPGILGAAGVKLWDRSYERRTVHGWHDPTSEIVEVDLVGHAWFLKTAWIHHLFSQSSVTGTNGEDIELCARAYRIEGIRSFCPPHPRHDKRRWGSLDGVELGSDGIALSRRPTHLEERDRIVRAEIEAGWKPCFMRAAAVPSQPESGARAATKSEPRPDAPRRSGDEARRTRRVLLLGCDVEGRSSLYEPTDTLERYELGGEFAGRIDLAVQQRLDAFEAEDSSTSGQTFDVIDSDRTIEWRRDPLGTLRRLRGKLSSDGRLRIRCSNLRRQQVLNGLFSGHWKGDERTANAPRSIRYFTRRELEKLLFRAGFRIERCEGAPGPGYDDWVRSGRPAGFQFGNLNFNGTSPEDAEEFFISEYAIEATPDGSRETGLTSIVIAVHNQLQLTRECLDSLERFTDEPIEIIVIDNASTDGTPEYLSALPNLRLLRNSENLGFPKAMNQGIRIARGEHVVLLNNDCVVTTGWLTRLLRAVRSDRKIGLAGPCSNCVSGAQQVGADYADHVQLDAFAWEWGKRHDRVLENTDRLIGFCMLIRREVIEKIGLLDERFGLGCFEDDDYTLRAIKAGFRAVIAFDAFVHHVGGATFSSVGVDFPGLMQANERLFRKKWEGEIGNAEPMRANDPADEGPLVETAPGGGLLLKRRPMVLSLCMIVRNSSRTLGPCLESIKPWVDEMIVVDTGSTDDTPEIAAAIAARVFHFPWPDSFSIARNESIRHARGQWIFWMDSDDTIDRPCGAKLRELAYRKHDPELLGFVMQVHCPGLDGDFTVVDHVKLFRNLPPLRFENRIHEQILPAIRRLGGKVEWTELFVRHSGSDPSPEAQARKRERDLGLLHLEESERPNHPYTLFNLGMTYSDAGEHAKAEMYLVRSLEHSQQGETTIRKAYALLVHSQEGLRRLKDAEATCRRGLEVFPLDDELRFRLGHLLHEQGRLAEATEIYEKIFVETEDRHFTSLDPGIRGAKAHQNLAVLYQEMGDLASCERHWRAILNDHPNHPAAHLGLKEVERARERLRSS